jgi:hypothetical protein
MRYSSSVTSVSWIPSEAVKGITRPVFDIGLTHYDDPLPDHLDDLEAWRAAGRFRFANHLEAWVEVEDGRIVDAGHTGGGLMGSTTVRVAGAGATFAPVPLDDLQPDVVLSDDEARFVQTTGGRTGLPAPRHINRPPYMQFYAPVVWTTLALKIDAEGSPSYEVVGASAFPRHWIYDSDGELVAKVGVADFKGWYHGQTGDHTPWGDEESPALVTAVEPALERELATQIMRSGTKPKVRQLKAEKTLTEQGEESRDVYLLLDGVLAVDVDGEVVAEVGPGALLGERAALEGGRRTSTLRAMSPVRVAVVDPADLDPAALAEVSTGHRREEGAAPAGSAS